ncbi:MAG TPA: hypothetical protein VLI90_09490 [Tepidisphaeraceae bacterium]|nr:hypothetical protein [Tepidisphaeraceae bacterium]
MPRQPTKRSNSRAKSDIALPGEKVVRETKREVGVKPVKAGPDAKRPTPGVALDRRREVAPSGPAEVKRSEANPVEPIARWGARTRPRRPTA